jgi:diguanylate cyclase (GGDEF)-like protein
MLYDLANRRPNRLDFEWMKASSTAARVVLMIDVDLQAFNDSYAIRASCPRLGETLAGIAAETMGFAGRYGGEEFCLLVPNIDSLRALEIGETVRAAVQELAMPHCTSHYQTVTVRVGVACARPNDKQQPGDLIEAADAALYAAKHRGRNAVVEHGIVRMTDGGIALAS